ncbi:MAG: isoamylase early set domain-containing protein [Anaerolineae bacterium]
MTIKKQFLKSRPECKVKFRVTKDRAGGAQNVHLVGDFNDWDTEATPMKALKSGDFTTTLGLDLDQEYEFRYLLDGKRWLNDQTADKLVPTPYPNVQNSVIVT